MRTMNAYTYVATPFFPLQRHRFISRFNSFSFFFISFCICKRGKKCPRIRRKPNTLKFLSLRQELSLLRQKKKKVLFLHILLTTDSLILLRIVGQHLLSCKTIAKKKENNQGIPLFEPWRSEDLIIARSQLAGPPPCSKMVESACAFLVPRAFNLNRIQTIGLSLDTLSQNDELLTF